MGWEKRRKRREKMIIIVPYPAQGHVTPAVKLASAISTLGFQAVVITPNFVHRRGMINKQNQDDGVIHLSIPDGLDLEEDSPRDFFAIEKAMETHMPLHLQRLIRDELLLDDDDGGISTIACMVVDLLASWAITVAMDFGIQVAGFWPVNFSAYQLISSIPYLLRHRIISQTGEPGELGYNIPGHPFLSGEDLPWLIGTSSARIARFRFWLRTLDRCKHLPFLLTNSSSSSSYPDQQLQDNNNNNNILLGNINNNIYHVGPLNLLDQDAKTMIPKEEDEEDEEDDSSKKRCLGWLDKQRPASVVYVSFGSWVSPIPPNHVTQLALALRSSGRPFLWVLGPTWREGLPPTYLSEQEEGMVVTWAPQVEVLKHVAVGCYLTHCGWNSTVEAVQCGKRMLCYPLAGDQFLNCSYIVHLWGVGLRIPLGLDQKDVRTAIDRVMMDDDFGGMMDHKLAALKDSMMGTKAVSTVLANLARFLNQLT